MGSNAFFRSAMHSCLRPANTVNERRNSVTDDVFKQQQLATWWAPASSCFQTSLHLAKPVSYIVMINPCKSIIIQVETGRCWKFGWQFGRFFRPFECANGTDLSATWADTSGCRAIQNLLQNPLEYPFVNGCLFSHVVVLVWSIPHSRHLQQICSWQRYWKSCCRPPWWCCRTNSPRVEARQFQMSKARSCHQENDKNGRHSSAKLGKSLVPSAKGSNNRSSLARSAQHIEQHENRYTHEVQTANHCNDQNDHTRGTCWLTFPEIDWSNIASKRS